MTRSRRASLSLLAVFLFPPLSGHAQAPTRIVKHQITCATCRVEFTKIATIGKPSDAALISRASGIERDSRGRYFAFSDFGQIIVFDSAGAFIRAFGRAGNGPGEFAPPTAVGAVVIPTIRAVRVGNGDSIFVFHSGRISVFSPLLAYVRTITPAPMVSGSGSVYPGADGSWIVGGNLARGRGAGPRVENRVLRRIHVVGPRGDIRSSLGKADTIPPGGRTAVGGGFFRASPDGRSIWLDHGEARYIFDQWSVSNNAHLGRIEMRDIPWFTERTSVTEQGRIGQYQRTVGGSFASIVGVDTSGFLWINGRVLNPSAPAQAASPRDRYGALYLEILDPRTGTLRSSQKVDQPYALSTRGDFAYSGAEDADGVVSFTTYRFRYVAR